jgi:site-specific DNA recombinase
VASQPGDWQIVAVYSDDASGATSDRPELQKALRAARAGLFDTLLVYRVDRFSRSLRDLTTLLDDLDDASIVFRSATEPFDTSSPVGRMLVQMLGVFAEFERETIIDRVINGMERKAAKGLWTGGARPLGYLIDRTLDKLVPAPTESGTVKLIFDLYTRDRLGTQAIANTLNERGLRTRIGKSWSPHTVEIVLTNRTYLGEKRFRDITVPDAHQAIITAEQFDLAQRILGKRSAQIGQRAANPSEYTLTGLIRCPQCGRRYIGTAAHGRSKAYRYYTCWSRVRYGTQGRLRHPPLQRRRPRSGHHRSATGLLHQQRRRHRPSHGRIPGPSRHLHLPPPRRTRRRHPRTQRRHRRHRPLPDRLRARHPRRRDPDIGTRLTTLKAQSKQIRARKAQLEFELDQPPQALTPGDLTKIHDHIRQINTEGSPNARKAMFEALIHEITITADDSVKPTFKLPLTGNDEGLALEGPALADDHTNPTVRALTTEVGDTGIEPVTSSVSANVHQRRDQHKHEGPQASPEH